MIVLDASVILKWMFGDEAGADRARLLRDRHISGEDLVAVHDLCFYEMANVMVTKTPLHAKDAVEAFSLIYDFDLEVFSFGREEFVSGITLARQYGMTLYDATYITLARRLHCQFVTADRKLFERAKTLREVKLL